MVQILNFRYDINGLRAIAVIAVVLFHFNSSWVPGGFAGVDVFLVISGFLMTGVIFRGFESHSFNLFKFYIARANRIIPALAILCLALLIFGWFYLNPLDYRVLGKHVASSMGFFSNVIYLRESGYFDVASYEKWLLHTWSLSVEWQFYILYPIALMILKRFLSIDSLGKILVIGTILGFVFSVFATQKWPDSAYYLLPTRVWEMMFGGIAYLYPLSLRESQKKLIEWLSLALIFLSYAFISSETAWPGFFALIPVLGAFGVIIANRQDSFITNNVVFQALGKWSYSVYLWHWPIVVFGYYFNVDNWWVIGIGSSVALGWISYSYVESLKLRSYTEWKNIPMVTPIWAVFLISFLGNYVYKTSPNLYLYQLPSSVLNSIERKPYECFDKEFMHTEKSVVCKLTEGKTKVLALGDSHSYASLPAVETVSKENDIALFYTGFSGCPPLLDVSPIRNDQNRKNCRMLNKKAVKFAIDNAIDKVFLAARWTYYTEGDYSGTGMQYLSTGEQKKDKQLSIESLFYGLESNFEFYAEHGIDVILMLQVPMQKSSPDGIYFNALNDKKLSKEKLDENSISFNENQNFQWFTNKMITGVASKFDNVYIIDPSDYMCNQAVCAVGTEVNSYYFDDDHLSIIGAHVLDAPIREALLN